KPMAAGEGGMVATDDPELEQRCQSLINCGRRRPGDTFNAPLLGANYRMTEWQGGVLLAQLERLPEQIKNKGHQAERLRAGLRAIPGITVLARERRVTCEVIYLFLFQVDEARLGVSRNRFLRALRAEGIPCGVANEPVYRSDLFPMASTPYRTACRLAGDEVAAPHECPTAGRLLAQLVAIPHQLLLGSDVDIDDIAAAVAKVASLAAQLSTAALERES